MTLPKKPLRRKSYRKTANRLEALAKSSCSPNQGDGQQVSINELLHSGLKCHQAGQLRSAVDLYQQVLDLDSSNTEAMHLLGVIAHQQAQFETAVDLIRAAIRLQPNAANYHLNLGSALQAIAGQEDCPEAVSCYETALRLDKNLVLAHNNLANALRKQGRFGEALHHLKTALHNKPAQLEVLNNLASLLIDMEDLEQARSVLGTILQIDSEMPEANCNLALIEARMGFPTRAIELYQKGLNRQPNLMSAWNNLGQLLSEQGAISEATAAFEQVAQLAPRKYRKLKAQTVCPVIPQSIQEIQIYRSRLAERLEQLQGEDLEIGSGEWESSTLNPPFYLPYHGLNDRQLKMSWARLFEKHWPRPELSRGEGQPLVGFVVADRHVPVFLKFVGGFLEHLPSFELKLSVIGSRNSINELSRSSHSRNVETLAIPNRLDQAARIIQNQCFDAIYYFEPDADAFNYFLACQRLAPVQFTSWGIPVTTGISSMTDFLSNQWIEPKDGSQHYCENLVRLKRLPAYYHRPLEIESKPREFFGFSHRDRLYGCLQSLFKFHPAFDEVLASILHQDEQARLVLVEGRQTYWTSLLKKRWAVVMPEVADRIHILPPQNQNDFRALLETCDVLLDPFPFGGGATTYDAMFVGTPTVTLPGQFMRGRVTLGCWMQLGIDDCVASDSQDYIAKAIRIANESDQRHELKKKILSANAELFEDQTAVLELREWLLQRIANARSD